MLTEQEVFQVIAEVYTEGTKDFTKLFNTIQLFPPQHSEHYTSSITYVLLLEVFLLVAPKHIRAEKFNLKLVEYLNQIQETDAKVGVDSTCARTHTPLKALLNYQDKRFTLQCIKHSIEYLTSLPVVDELHFIYSTY